MPLFSYEAKKGPRELIKGTIEAESQDAAVQKLSQQGYVPIKVLPTQKRSSQSQSEIQASQPKVIKKTRQLSPFKRVRSRDLTIFTEQLASLVKSKIPLLEVMNILYEQTENANLKSVISDIYNDIKDGKTFSQSLGKYPDVFPALYINMIETGEAGGVLEKTLLRLVEFRNREEEFKSKITSALIYPVFIIIVGIVTVFVLLGFIIPRMSTLFTEIGQRLPVTTQILLTLSEQIKRYWLVALAVVSLVVFTLKKKKNVQKNKIVFDRFKLKLPLLGNFFKKSAIARFTRTLALLLANGIPLFQAIKITIPTLENEIFKLELERVRQDILDGMSLEQSIKKSQWFPRFMSNMLAVGEKGGSLEGALQEVADFYEREVDKTTKMITSLLEPIIILIMGLVVGFIVFAMLLPIFQINLGM
jgi:type II secretory pathway component PulF